MVSMVELIDSHSHLHQPWFEPNLDDVINRAKENQVSHIINCASSPKNYQQVISTTRYDEIDITLGIQPTHADEHLTADILRDIDDLDKKVVAIGEVGLDYYWVKDETLRERQHQLFIDCINLANELGIPLVTHTRKAESQSLDLLEKHADTPVLLHSFDGNLKEVNRAVDLGYLITVPTIVTRRKNRRKVATRAGLDNIMLETDAPFATTKEAVERNEPKYIRDAADYLSKLLDTDFREIAKVTTRNSRQFHQI